MGAVTAYHLRMLCESPWNGGGGYTPEQVGQMTLDQIWFRLCDMEILKRTDGQATKTMHPAAAAGMMTADDDGFIRGRAEDGTPIKGRIGGKSKARMLMEEEERKRQKEKRQRRKGK
jgi:hypothetical protein